MAKFRIGGQVSNQWLSLGFPLGGFGGVGLWFRGWGLNWWHWALVSGLGLESVAGGVAVVAWVEISGFKSVAFSVVVGCCRRGCGGLG